MSKKQSFILILIVILIGGIIFLNLKFKKSDIEKVSYNFEECYNSAYDYMLNNYGDSTFYFYEAIAKMSMNTNDSHFYDSSVVEEVKIVYQLIKDSSVITFIYPEGCYAEDSFNIEIVKGLWKEDLPINICDISITLDSVIGIYNKLNVIKPNGQYVLMRHPDIDSFNNPPYFFFGSDTSFICIDYNGTLIKH